MARLEELIKDIADPRLRAQIGAEVAALKSTKSFGLVFEEHLPEIVQLPGLPVKPGARVAKRDEGCTNLFIVRSRVNGKKVTIVPERGGEEETAATESLVVVKRFGEPMYPALVPMDRVRRAPGKPYHTLINADNFHALQLLQYAYESQVDVIYIDPPYNTGARDWKYNNDYVDRTDRYRHSKWLSMMKKRLALAKRLLKPEGVLICAIDDYEYHHLLCLLEAQWSPNNYLGTVVVRSKPQGRATTTGLSVQHEYLIYYGASEKAQIQRIPKTDAQLRRYSSRDDDGLFTWENFRKSGQGCRREDRKRQFFPLYVRPDRSLLVPEMTWDEEAEEWIVVRPKEKGLREILPLTEDGEERVWKWSVERTRNELHELRVIGEDARLEIQKKLRMETETNLPFTVWHEAEVSATDHGTKDIVACFGDKDAFSFPKSKYAVRKAILAGTSKRDALIVDFFAGSGTTCQAAAMLNAEDGGTRRCVLVTNNEVSAQVAAELATQGVAPGSEKWEKAGICEAVTWPRIKYCIQGKKDDGTPLPGTDIGGRPMAEGFEENLQYLKLDFLDPAEVGRGDRYEAILPILWLMAGASGDLELSKGLAKYHFPKKCPFCVLIKEENFTEFATKLVERPDITHVFLVTDSSEAFNEMASQIRGTRRFIQLYKSYLDNFKINLE